jgi:hypothetical protein
MMLRDSTSEDVAIVTSVVISIDQVMDQVEGQGGSRVSLHHEDKRVMTTMIVGGVTAATPIIEGIDLPLAVLHLMMMYRYPLKSLIGAHEVIVVPVAIAAGVELEAS